MPLTPPSPQRGEGVEEPDSWVMFGNHVDAWTYGAIDPNSGTAVSLEMARVLMSVVNSTSWRPRRFIFIFHIAKAFLRTNEAVNSVCNAE